ncbi:hypothetical protein [Arthrobacter sp.]|uniref:hypothetical protein n=1 Tax=Arthrobacter sp. TaxID=1667 RepID=UPI00281134DB|nr:hypothetical protein [Arthrobacter sp.]
MNSTHAAIEIRNFTDDTRRRLRWSDNFLNNGGDGPQEALLPAVVSVSSGSGEGQKT